MKVKSLLSVLAFSSISLIAHAAETDNLAVYSTQQDKGATSLGKQAFHTKSFDVTLANIGDKDADLSKLCLKAYNGHGKSFKLDTIDETLTTEKLAPKKTLKGIAVFASNDESVYDASMVKLISLYTSFGHFLSSMIIAKRHYFDNSQICSFATYQGTGCNHF